MEEVRSVLFKIIEDKEFIHGVISNLRDKSKKDGYTKIDIQPVIIQDELKYQLTYEFKNKVLHENLSEIEFKSKFIELLENEFRQAMIFSKANDYQVLISKKGKVKVIKQKASKKEVDLSHNRTKEYILEDGKPVDFLIRLGIMTKDGKVIPRRYDKFRQINRFLELVEDIIPEIEKEETINIVDFGCGKSYLTFALYYYLVQILNLNVNIVGLDLKKDVIEFCNEVSEDLDYKDLKFIYGDIKDYNDSNDIDMIVTLHACDIATDAALVKAINWNCKAILSVPCCQHELFNKIENENLEAMLKHGIIKDKLSSLVTDSLRGLVLESRGYDVQLLEFIDMTHTPKNILIRAVKSNKIDRKKALDEYNNFKEFWGLKDLFIDQEL